ncbi:MAG: MATE family efflux transporter [bacterium]|nr:MATE family efflux transporter [bacterium]
MKHRLNRWKDILALAWPLIIANSFWNLQLTIDRVFLANYSTESLGAAMAVMGIFWTPMALLQQTAAYVTTFVAQYVGAKQISKIGAAVWQSIYISVIGGLLFLLFIPFSPLLFSVVGHGDVMQNLEVLYFNAICWSALPTALVAAFSGFFTGLGVTKTVMKINAVGLVFNVVFDFLLISGPFGLPSYGISGAGYATAISALASALYGGYLVFQAKHNALYQLWDGWKANWDLTKRFIRYGLPSGAQWALEGLAFTVFLVVIGRLSNGEAALAASSIAVTLMMLGVLPVMGVAQSVMVQVGQHLGEKKPELAVGFTWSGIQVSAIYIAFVSLLYVAIPGFFVGWFANSGSGVLWAEVQDITSILLVFVACFLVFDSVNLNLSFALKGAGDTRFVSLVALIVPWPIMVLPTILFQSHMGAVYYAWAAASVYITLQSLVFFLRFRQGKWKTMSVIGEQGATETA